MVTRSTFGAPGARRSSSCSRRDTVDFPTATDPATPMYYNKDGGKKYHTTARCASVKSRYLPLSAITYGDLSSYPYNQLSPCTTCGAPERPEVVAAWNSVIDEAYDELGLTP